MGNPVWNDEDFEKLFKNLQHRGYGWLRPKGVRRELERMTQEWQGPQPLFGEPESLSSVTPESSPEPQEAGDRGDY